MLFQLLRSHLEFFWGVVRLPNNINAHICVWTLILLRIEELKLLDTAVKRNKMTFLTPFFM